MKEKSLWIKADEGAWEDRKSRITTALESGADVAFVNEEDAEKVRELGSIRVAAPLKGERSDADVVVIGIGSEGDGTKALPSDFNDSMDLNRLRRLSKSGKETAAYVVIKGKNYEEFAAALGKVCDHLVVIGTDWKVIPLENLIATLQGHDVDIIAGVKSAAEAKVALETLEHGADGVLLDADASEIKKVANIIESTGTKGITLASAKITMVKPIGMGDRVCVDTCSLLSKGEGMLVGSQSNGLFLVHAETEESPYVASRPFRVNAGAVHAYVRVGDKTRYLSELGAGDEVLIVGVKGTSRKAIIGRVKIERRPLMLVEAEIKGDKIKTILQNAETIKLVSRDGTPKAVTALKPGDEVLVHYEEGGRHFGMKVEETIVEK
ncbi:MAG: 3-dehydroquinate synthase II [Methanosarcinales archaeon]|nr:MAG: 3-dehydroquinate synthase II [Methanosarcinales archaeon]